jgi:hypothetical protein
VVSRKEKEVENMLEPGLVIGLLILFTISFVSSIQLEVGHDASRIWLRIEWVVQLKQRAHPQRLGHWLRKLLSNETK